MKDLNTRTESVIDNGNNENEDNDQSEGQIVVGDPQVDDEAKELKEEQTDEEESEPLPRA